MGRSNARGFSLLELVVSIAIVIVLAWLLIHALTQSLLVSRMQARWNLDQSNVGRLIDNLTTEEDDAWAIYNPPTDAYGRSNADGHEVDFFARDGKQRPYFWAYDYNSVTQTLTRYRLSALGGTPTQDATYTGITKFYAQTYPVTALQDASTPIYSALYNGASLRSGTVHFYPSQPWIAGGNNITYVHIEGGSFKQDLQLATSTAPSGFTVVVYYTPSPSPTPSPGPFKTWPAKLVMGVSGASVGASSVTIASTGTMGIAFSQFVNRALGGGVALAASSTACYARALNSNTPDMSIPTNAQGQYAIAVGGYEIGVTTDGCEVYSADLGTTWTPVGAPGAAIAQPITVQYEPRGSSGSWYIGSNTCSGIAAPFSWYPAQTGAQNALPWKGSVTGSCSVAYSDGQSSQTPTADNGLVSVTVAQVYVLAGHVAYSKNGGGSYTGDCVSNCFGVPNTGSGGIKGCIYYHIDCTSNGNYSDLTFSLIASSSPDDGKTLTTVADCETDNTNATGSWVQTTSGCGSVVWNSYRDATFTMPYAPPGGNWDYMIWPIGVSNATIPTGPVDLDAADKSGDYIWPGCLPNGNSTGATVYGTSTTC